MVTYKTNGTCSTRIHLEVEDGILKSVKFDAGCSGNLEAISRLVVGMDAHDVIKRLKGTPCGSRRTSCPDQLARALENYLAEGN
jgi:uncharacterized protein (TIGR03905 family)